LYGSWFLNRESVMRTEPGHDDQLDSIFRLSDRLEADLLLWLDSATNAWKSAWRSSAIMTNSFAPMLTFSRSLEQSLHRSLALANERLHDHATLDHLLLALIDDQDAAPVMRAYNVDLERLRHTLTVHLGPEAENPVSGGNQDSEPAAEFQRVIQRAVIHVQSSGREEVTGANVLVQIFAERESHAVYLLEEQGMTRYDAASYISHGIAKDGSHGYASGKEPKPPTILDEPSGLLAEVRLLNDDYTPMEFVVHVLERVFDKDREAATRIMLEIHNEGVGTCGVYPFDVADAKVTEVRDFARQHQHPLQCVLERSSSA
jgi:ATP-dependent Clp protease adapter protein ClpS